MVARTARPAARAAWLCGRSLMRERALRAGHASDSSHLVTLLLCPSTDHDGVASEKSFDPDSAGFVGDASLSEKSYDPDSAGFLRCVGGCWWCSHTKLFSSSLSLTPAIKYPHFQHTGSDVW